MIPAIQRPGSVLATSVEFRLFLFREGTTGRKERLAVKHARKILFFLVAATLALGLSGYAQQPAPESSTKVEALRNADILKMIEAKLSDDLIITKIKSSPSDFDTSIDAVLKLKAAGTSDAVIRAMAEVSQAARPVVANRVSADSSGLVKIEMKTPVRLLVDEPLSSKTAKSGQTFRLVAAEDLLVNGKVVVAKGAQATGRVTFAQGWSLGHQQGNLEVTVDTVQAVDGHNIPLEGHLAVGGSGAFGKVAKIAKGESINAVVAN